MKYHLYTLFIILIIGFTNEVYAAKVENLSVSICVQQDTLGNAKQLKKRLVAADRKESLTQTVKTLTKVPKAKNKAIPRTVIPTSINIKPPRINPVKVKVNTQVKIKL